MEHLEMIENDPDLLSEYDFSKGIRGKYAAAYCEGCNIIALDPDLSDVFPDSDSVNHILRPIAELIRAQRQVASQAA